MAPFHCLIPPRLRPTWKILHSPYRQFLRQSLTSACIAEVLHQALPNLHQGNLSMQKRHAGSSTPVLAWHVLYRAALFETDRSKLPQRIAEAEEAILARIKELFVVNSDHIEEDQILEDALYALRALRNCALPESSAA